MATSARYVASFRRCSDTCGIVAFVISLLVLAGWSLDIPVLRRWHPHLAAASPGEALSLALLGASLWLSQSKRTGPRFRVPARLGALAAVLIAVGSLLDVGPARDLVLDHVLAREAPTAFSMSASDGMRPLTALLFLSAGLSLLGLAARDRRGAALSQGLAVVAGVWSLLGLLGHAYDTVALLGFTLEFHAIPLPAASAGCLLSIGLLCLRPDRGFMTAFTSDGPGGRITRWLLPAAVVVPGALNIMTLALRQSQVVDTQMAEVIDTTTMVAILVAAIAWTARSLDRLDTEKREREEVLRISEGRFRSVVETATDAIVAADHDGRVVLWNEAAEALFGHTSAEIVGCPLSTILPCGFRQDDDRTAGAVVFSDESRLAAKTVETTGRRKDGSEVPVGLSLATWRTQGAVHQTAIIRDLTALKRADAALRVSEAQFRELFDEAPSGYHELDTTGRVVRVNRTELATLGYSAEEMIGRPVWEFADEKDVSREAVQKKLAGTLAPAPSHERVYRRKDGTRVTALIQDRLLRDGEGRIAGIRSSFQDITERDRAEAERERLIAELQTTLAEVRVLKGFIPICSSCRQIRDDQGFWDQLESYITRHSAARFSHGICPDCMEKLYPGM